MKTSIHDASARQHPGEPSSGLGPNGGRNDRLRGPDLAGLDGEIVGLVDRSTQELRRAWQTLHHTGPPLGLSRDLIIKGLADKLQQRVHWGPSRALQRRLQILAAEFEKDTRSFDPRIVLKAGATLARQWRGHTHTVLVREDGFEYEGEHYRSLTVIAEQITGAHWSGTRGDTARAPLIKVSQYGNSRFGMAQDPLSYVASWVAPADSGAETDPLVAMIRERYRLFRVAEEIREHANEN